MIYHSTSAPPSAARRAIVAQTRCGPVYEERPGSAAALVRGTLRRSRIPRRLITPRFVDVILCAVAASPEPCHAIGTAFAIARHARVALARTTGRFPPGVTELADAVNIRVGKARACPALKGTPR